MTIFELVVGLLLACALLTLLAQRIRVPYPALLALGGAALALWPGTPDIRLDPELALALFVAPVLLDAAYDSSPRDLRANWLPVAGLVLVAVLATVAAVACVARLAVPGMSWPVALALGAIVAPPDAAAATAVLRQVSPPHRLLVILEGESLLNDATALLVYRLAVGMAVAGSASPWAAIPGLVLASVGGVLLGWLLARAWRFAVPMIEEITVSVLIQFLATFGIWMLADRLGVSAVLTMVAYAVTLARRPTRMLDAVRRRASYAVWDVAVFVLNALAFILVGLQLRPILQRSDGEAWRVGSFAALVLGVVILVRIAVVLAGDLAARRLRPGMALPSGRAGLAVAWCGMRGIVTLAAALALPDGLHGMPAFPQRDLVVAAAFAVVLGTLLLQGMTLRPLLVALDLGEDDAVQQEVLHARAEAARAALAALDGEPGRLAEAARKHYRARLHGAARRDDEGGEAVHRAIQAERRTLQELRLREAIGEDAFHVLEEELDWAEVSARSGS